MSDDNKSTDSYTPTEALAPPRTKEQSDVEFDEFEETIKRLDLVAPEASHDRDFYYSQLAEAVELGA